MLATAWQPASVRLLSLCEVEGLIGDHGMGGASVERT
jgi:hypothetical protein